MIRNRSLRLAVWYSATLLWAPAFLWAFMTHRPLVGFALVFVTGVCVYFGLRKHVCPGCGRAMRTISLKITHCLYCGAAYTDPE